MRACLNLQIIWLDVDNIPLRDPSFLYDSEEYKATGALFWQDYWANTMAPQVSHITNTSILMCTCKQPTRVLWLALRIGRAVTDALAISSQRITLDMLCHTPTVSGVMGDEHERLCVCMHSRKRLTCRLLHIGPCMRAGRANVGCAQGEVVPGQL